MALKIEDNTDLPSGSCRLSIAEDFTIYVIDGIKDELSKELDIYNNFELDLSEVEEFDSSALQLLLAFDREIKRQEKQLVITGVSSAILKLFNTYGLSQYFNLESAA